MIAVDVLCWNYAGRIPNIFSAQMIQNWPCHRYTQLQIKRKCLRHFDSSKLTRAGCVFFFFLFTLLFCLLACLLACVFLNWANFNIYISKQLQHEERGRNLLQVCLDVGEQSLRIFCAWSHSYSFHLVVDFLVISLHCFNWHSHNNFEICDPNSQFIRFSFAFLSFCDLL